MGVGVGEAGRGGGGRALQHHRLNCLAERVLPKEGGELSPQDAAAESHATRACLSAAAMVSVCPLPPLLSESCIRHQMGTTDFTSRINCKAV